MWLIIFLNGYIDIAIKLNKFVFEYLPLHEIMAKKWLASL